MCVTYMKMIQTTLVSCSSDFNDSLLQSIGFKWNKVNYEIGNVIFGECVCVC